MKERSNFGKNLRRIREDFGLDPGRLADGLDLGPYGRQVISNWENGRREPSLAMLNKIADFFGVSTDALLGNEKEDLTVSKLEHIMIHNLDKLSEDEKKTLFNIINAFLNR